jgi:hypothetical protein
MVKLNGICARYCAWAFAETDAIKIKTPKHITEEICSTVFFIVLPPDLIRENFLCLLARRLPQKGVNYLENIDFSLKRA